MNPFLGDALVTGLKEGVVLYCSARLALALCDRGGRPFLKLPIAAGILAVTIISPVVLGARVTVEFRDFTVRMIGYVFGLFYLFSLGSLYHSTGTDLLGPLRGLFSRKAVLIPVVFLLTVVYSVPDMTASSLYIADLYAMAGQRWIIYAAAAAGFAATLAVSHLVANRIRIDVMRLFGLPQALLTLSLLKLAAGGVKGFAELSLIPSVQAGLIKLVHDMVHQTFLFFMVPDHPILSVTAWKYIGLVFGSSVGLWLSLVILVFPLALFVKKHFSEPVATPPEVQVPARRRILVKAVRDQRFLKSAPVFAFMLFIVSTWFVQGSQSEERLYRPEARVVAAEGGKISIPLQSPGEDLRDGRLHKFAATVDGSVLRLFVMKKPDGTLAVCLDACEICSPEGYGQSEKHVVCLYCSTPIPFETLGKPGGCNPIPLAALVTDKDVQVPLAELAVKAKMINASKGQEGGGR